MKNALVFFPLFILAFAGCRQRSESMVQEDKDTDSKITCETTVSEKGDEISDHLMARELPTLAKSMTTPFLKTGWERDFLKINKRKAFVHIDLLNRLEEHVDSMELENIKVEITRPLNDALIAGGSTTLTSYDYRRTWRLRSIKEGFQPEKPEPIFNAAKRDELDFVLQVVLTKLPSEKKEGMLIQTYEFKFVFFDVGQIKQTCPVRGLLEKRVKS